MTKKPGVWNIMRYLWSLYNNYDANMNKNNKLIDLRKYLIIKIWVIVRIHDKRTAVLRRKYRYLVEQKIGYSLKINGIFCNDEHQNDESEITIASLNFLKSQGDHDHSNSSQHTSI